MLIYTLYGLFILACIVLVVAVLLQPGKSDAGALFSSSVSSTAFGPRGTQTLLAKITIGAAALFMLCALALGLPAILGTRSVLQSQPESAPQPAAPAPAAPATNSNTATQTVPVTAPPSATTAPESNANAGAASTAPANANTTTKQPAASNTANSKPNQKQPGKK
ncbi:MAG: preprotein translocase subunit SecG [Pyrinomonadaceae bacterium]|nr:preprotein translocase subunit SecG [Pyrinomonadaceae bacterium]